VIDDGLERIGKLGEQFTDNRKCGTVQIFGNDYNKSKPDSGGN
jgi:hypothetical protein